MKKRVAITILMIVMAIGLFVVMASCDPKDPEDPETVKTVDVAKVGDYVLEGDKYVYNGEGEYELKFVKGVAKMRIKPTSAQRYLLETDFEHTLYIDGNLVEDVSQFKFNKDSQYFIKFVADESLKSGKCVVKRRAFLDEGERGVTEGYNFIPFTSKHDGKTWIQTYKTWFYIADEGLNKIARFKRMYTTTAILNIDLEADKKYYVVIDGSESKKIAEIDLEIDKEIEEIELSADVPDGEVVNHTIEFNGRDRIFKFIPKDDRAVVIGIPNMQSNQWMPDILDDDLNYATIINNDSNHSLLNGNNKGKVFYIVMKKDEDRQKYDTSLQLSPDSKYTYELKIDGVLRNEAILQLPRGAEYELELTISGRNIEIVIEDNNDDQAIINNMEFDGKKLLVKPTCPIYNTHVYLITQPRNIWSYQGRWEVHLIIIPK